MLDPEDMRLRDLTAWLTTPAKSGVYLSVDDLDRIGGQLGIRIAPMSRSSAVEQLFQSAALDDRVDDLFTALTNEIAEHRERYVASQSPAMQPWIACADDALDTMTQLQETWRNRDPDQSG